MICSVSIKSIWITQLPNFLLFVKAVPTNLQLLCKQYVPLEALHFKRQRLSLSASPRLSTNWGLFVSPAHHRLTSTTTTNTLPMNRPDGSFGTSLREPRASWQIKICSNWFPAESWKSETYISLVSSDTQTTFVLECTAKENIHEGLVDSLKT